MTFDNSNNQDTIIQDHVIVDESTNPTPSQQPWRKRHYIAWGIIKYIFFAILGLITVAFIFEFFDQANCPSDKMADEAYEVWCASHIVDYARAYGCDQEDARLYVDWVYNNTTTEWYIVEEGYKAYANQVMPDGTIMWQFNFTKPNAASMDWEISDTKSDDSSISSRINLHLIGAMDDMLAEVFAGW